MSEEEQQYTIQPVKDKQPEKPSEGGDKSKPSAQDFVNPGPAVPGSMPCHFESCLLLHFRGIIC